MDRRRGVWQGLVIWVLLAALRTYALPPQSTHGVLPVLPARGQVTVDGRLSREEWDLRGCMYVYNALQMAEQYSVQVYAMWDREALYLGLYFRDPTPLTNNADAPNAPYDGWQADGFQARFTTDYGQIHLDAWYSSRADMSVGCLSYDAPCNAGNSKIFRARGKAIQDASGFQEAFRAEADGKSYVQELRIPWALLYRKVPAIQAGLRFRFTGECYWGTPEAIKWPKVMWSDPINPQNPVRITVYQNPGVWGTAELLGDGAQAQGDAVAEGGEDLRVQGPVPLRFAVPAEATKFTLAIDDARGRRVRNLVAHADVKTYQIGVKDGQPQLEVRWDARAEGGWDQERCLFLGDYVAPGDYVARVLIHQGLHVVHVGSFYNPGTPPWPTDDGSGSWLSDHAPATMVAALPPTASSKGRILLMAPGAESGVPYIGINAEGCKIWQWTRGGMGAVAGNEKYAYFTFDYFGKRCLGRQDPDTGQQVKFSTGVQDLPLTGLGVGLAVNPKYLAVAIQDAKEVQLLDPESGALVKTVAVAPATHLAFASPTRLIGLTGDKVFVADAEAGKVVETFAVPGIPTPHAIACDRAGRLYVSDPVSATVKVFDRIAANAKLVQEVGQPGGRRPGRYHPLQMAAPRSLAVEERADGTSHLWCVEDHNTLRRVVVWDLGQKRLLGQPRESIVRDYIGGTGYCGSGGLLSDDVPDLGFYRGISFKLDYQNYTYQPQEVMGGAPDPRPDRTTLFSFGAYAAYGFGNGFHFFSEASGKKVEYYVEGEGLSMVFIRRGERWYCVAALGHRDHGVKFPAGFPQAEGAKVVFCWNDLNGDGYQQPEEVSWADVGVPLALRNRQWSYRCDRNLAWYHSGLAFRPVRFGKDGAPIYDLTKVERLPGDLGKRFGPGDSADVYRTKFGYAVVLPKPNYQDPNHVVHGLLQLEGYDEQGNCQWTYPTYWWSVHGAMTAPMAMPGVIMGALKITNIVDLDDRSLIALHGNIGQEFLVRDDGLYVAELFTDQRMAPASLGPDQRIAGKRIDDTSIGGEPFSGWIGRQNDGRVRYTYGLNDVRIAEITGLDTVRELPPQPLRLTEAELAVARQFVPTRQVAAKKDYTIAKGPAFDAGNPALGDAPLALKAGRETVARAALRYDERNLYVIWQVTDPTPFVNRGDAPELAFKSGDCVGLLVAPDGAHDPNALGGTRVLLTVLRDRPVAVVYRPTGPGNQPFIFASPVRKSPFQYVAVEPTVSFAVKRGTGEYTVTAAVPWTVLGVAPQPGGKLRGDLEVLGGRETTTAIDRIVRWVDQQTNVVNDVPTEAEFFPGRWGTFILQ